jgi:hypothetical protein|tara:strand:+ start:193 stop:645 length:453 start_codon:yes stop_codon:yes gene_type:complete
MAVATTAIKSIKTGIKLAKDTSEIAKELDKFFSAKNVIEEEAKKEQEKSKKNKSLNQQAMANVLNRKKLRDAERSLKESLVWSGNAQIWEDLVKERSRLRKAQQEADEQAKYRKRVILERIRDGFIITGLLSFTAWIIVTLIEMILGKGK